MKDQRRNFVFIEFDSPDTVAKVMTQENHTIGEMEVSEKLLHCTTFSKKLMSYL